MHAPWFPHVQDSSDECLRLFCFPHAGGAASSYRSWRGALDGVSIWAVQPPGREARFSEPLLGSVEELLDALLPDLLPHLEGRRFAFFGHSLGALVAHSLTRRLESSGGPSPERLVVSGCRPPHLPNARPGLHELPDSEFLDALVELGGMPTEVRDREVLSRLFVPLLRSEMRMSALHVLSPQSSIAAPISALGGSHDPEVSWEVLQRWRDVTRGSFRARLLPGGHFFLRADEAVFLRTLLAELIDSPQGPAL